MLTFVCDGARPLEVDFVADEDDGRLAAGVRVADSPEVSQDLLGQVEADAVHHGVKDQHAVGVVRG